MANNDPGSSSGKTGTSTVMDAPFREYLRAIDNCYRLRPIKGKPSSGYYDACRAAYIKAEKLRKLMVKHGIKNLEQLLPKEQT